MKIRNYVKAHPYTLFFLYIPVYVLWFCLVEHFIVGTYWVSYVPLDDAIPFVEQFVLAYVLWYPFLLGTAAYLYFADPDAFVRYAWSLVIGLSVSLLICSVFPNGQDLRPAQFPRDNFFTWLIGRLYSADTNTNVLPSMHVVGSFAASAALFDTDRLRRKPVIPACAAILGALIIASTVFIKQHSMLDIYAGFAVAVPIWLIIYRKRLFARKKAPAKQLCGEDAAGR